MKYNVDESLSDVAYQPSLVRLEEGFHSWGNLKHRARHINSMDRVAKNFKRTII